MGIISSVVYYKTTIPYELEEYILVNKILSSDECFSHLDTLSNEYIPLSIDISKFNKEKLDSCYPEGDYYALRITLAYTSEITLSTPNWNQDKGADKRLPPKIITVYDKDEKNLAKMIFEIQNAK
jgi:hypothetical protein